MGVGPTTGTLAFPARREDFLATKLSNLVQLLKKGENWTRKNSLWPMPFATACCGIELMSTGASRYDIGRFGAEAMRFTPRQCDLMICAGRVAIKMMPVLQRIYDAELKSTAKNKLTAAELITSLRDHIFSSLDQAGPLCRSVEDTAIMLGVMAGHDPKDSTSVDIPVPDYEAGLRDGVKGLRVGIVRQHFDSGLDDATGEAVREALQVLETQGATLTEVDLPNLDYCVPTYYVVAPAECSSNMSRFDGVRFGHRAADPEDLLDMYSRSRGEGFGEEVKRRIMTGTYVLSAGYYDAYYLQAQKVRQLISDDFRKAFETVDVIAGPTTPTPAFKLGDKTDDPITMYLNDIYTIGANLAGLPAMSAPCGMVEGLPVGLHLVGPHWAEESLLRTAHQYQAQTNWHRACPEAFQ